MNDFEAYSAKKANIRPNPARRALAHTSSRCCRRSCAVMASSGSQAPLVVVGSVNADLVLNIDRLPQPGETLGARSLEFFPGGKGANQAAAAAKLGYPTYFLGQVGTDSNNSALRAALSDAGVHLDHLKTVPGPSGTAVILVQSSGENSIIIVGGANQNTAAWELSAEAQQLIAGAGAVLLQREIPEHANIQVAKIASAAGVPVLLDAGGVDAPLPLELLQHLTTISPNETELKRITDLPTGNEQELLSAAVALQQRAAEQQQGGGSKRLEVLLKLGTAGSMMVGAAGSSDGVIRQPAVMAPQVVDTTGAGDCFTAAFSVGLLEGRTPAAAMKFAAAAASICVSRPGATPSLPTRAELDELLRTLA